MNEFSPSSTPCLIFQLFRVEVKRQPIFFLPCMAEAIGGAKHPFFK